MLKPTKKKTILVAEDDKFIAHAYRNALKLDGYEVEWASDGQEALAIFKKRRPDLILMDLVMPVLDGFTTLKHLRHQAGGRNVPVIILSNLGQDSDIKQCRKYGIADYLVKSNVSMSEVLQAIKKVLKPKKILKKKKILSTAKAFKKIIKK